MRKIAEKLNLKTKHKQESQEICFVPDDDYARFLNDRFPGLKEKMGNGQIFDQDGNLLGYHKGYPFYTIGQRKGLGIAVGKPVYVTEIDSEKNAVFVGDRENLNSKGLIANHVNWISFEGVEPFPATVKIRYNDRGKDAVVYPQNKKNVKVIFETFHQAVTPGQSVVFYRDDVVIGGGVIEKGFGEEVVPD